MTGARAIDPMMAPIRARITTVIAALGGLPA